jgi:hypothetical protein
MFYSVPDRKRRVHRRGVFPIWAGDPTVHACGRAVLLALAAALAWGVYTDPTRPSDELMSHWPGKLMSLLEWIRWCLGLPAPLVMNLINLMEGDKLVHGMAGTAGDAASSSWCMAVAPDG